MSNSSVASTPALNALGIDPWGAAGGGDAFTGLLTAIIVDVFEVESVNMTREISIATKSQYISQERER